MKASVVASLFFAVAVSACDFYDKCYCTNSDGSRVSDDTQTQACLQQAADTRSSDEPGPGEMTPNLEDGIIKCFGSPSDGGTVFHLDSCKHTQEC
ncbi:hypothetical protein LX36DRAFT_683682 [Colletotrichum falcatum]|nr:hypothetical protein LX36DRAFT_683682 [Colletotrichum falcatum]